MAELESLLGAVIGIALLKEVAEPMYTKHQRPIKRKMTEHEKKWLKEIYGEYY